MKKIVLILVVFICASCTLFSGNVKKDNSIEKEKTKYIRYVNKLREVKKSSEDLPFDVEVKFDKLTSDEVRYQVIIDNPKYELLNVKALAVHNKQTDDVFPSSGIFEKPLNLIPNKKPAGIILVGYIPYTKSIKSFNCEVKVIIEYTYQNKQYTRYYVTKK